MPNNPPNEEKKLEEEFSSYDFCGCYEGDVNYVFPSGLEKLKAFIAEQRERARRDAVEYIKTHSKRLHMVGGYEVSDEVLEAAHAKE